MTVARRLNWNLTNTIMPILLYLRAIYHEVIYKYFNLNNWARYVDKINKGNIGFYK